MHTEILSREQLEVLPLIKKFNKKFCLVGGTSIALHIGHRESIDFDLFASSPFSVSQVQKKVAEISEHPTKLLHKDADQIHYLVNGVKITFFYYPFEIQHPEKFQNIILMPSLLTLAAMKAYALGGRNKWKDYVDLYYLLKDHFSIDEISDKANEIFNGAFNAKLFRQQLSYFDDVNYEEKVFFLSGFEVNDDEIRSFLTEVSTRPF